MSSFAKHYAGLNITASENNGKLRPVSRITLHLDDENVITAGDDTGLELSADCPNATQAIANTLLSRFKGFRYQTMSANDAGIDPVAELGDGVTADGIYSVIAQISDDGSGYLSVTAPGEQEQEDEYPMDGPVTRAFTQATDRKIAETRSSITKTAEEIRAEVGNQITGLSSSIDIKLNGITQQVTGFDGRITTAQQTADKISWLVKSGTDSSNFEMTDRAINLVAGNINLSGYVTFSSLSNKNDQTRINGGNLISNTITADKLSVTDLSAIGAKIGGWSINSSGIVYESSDKLHRVTLRIVDSGTSGTGVFYVGSRKSASDSYSYPFRVNIDGTCSATAFTMSGSSKVDGASVTDSTISSSTLAGTNTNTGTISGGTISKPSISGGTLGGSTGGTYIGTVSGGTLSSCTTGGTSLKIGDYGNVGVNGSFPRLYGESSSLYGGTGYIIQGPSGATESGNITVNGNITCRGTKPRTMDTAHFGSRQLDAFETPLPTFSDYGTASLDETGVFHIIIDPIFAETVDNAYLPTVFLTKYGQGDIWVERVEHDIVTVRGTPGLEFAWETRYAQANADVMRLRVMGFDYQDESTERDFEGEAAVAFEHSADNVDYALAGYEYFTDFERSLTA